VAILRRVDRLTADNFDHHKYLNDGVWELRVDVGPGYRVYYGKHGRTLVLLPCAGSKRTQVSDIAKAVGYWTDYQRRQK
jgi:putative addiction module killer protein